MRFSPGAPRPSHMPKGCGALGAGLMRHRVAVAPAGGARASVTRSVGVRLSCPARLRRRAGVSATSPRMPAASARLPDFSPSSSAQSVSAARAVSTMMREEGARPSRASPGPCRRPVSRAIFSGQHQRMRFSRGSRPAGISARRRAARQSAKATEAAQSLAQWPTVWLAPSAAPRKPGFISCTAPASRPAGPSRVSISGAPSVHKAAPRAAPGARSEARSEARSGARSG